jgi:serine/threonine-protein kinase
LIGEGGMGSVYRAFDTRLERTVAIKFLNINALRNKKFVERFKREAINQANLNHQNIITVYGIVQDRENLGIVMEYVQGKTVEALINEYRKLSLIDSLFILRQTLAGISFAHNKGYIHRDIKPSNIILNNDGIVKIMDFGISKSVNEISSLTQTGAKIGTVLYMSPEQVNADEITLHTDIYSLGVTLFEMLTGIPPFNFKSEYEVMDAHLNKNIPPIGGLPENISSDINKTIQKATNKDRNNRFSSCDEFILVIDQILNKLSKNILSEKKLKTKNYATIRKRRSLFPVIIIIVSIVSLFLLSWLIINLVDENIIKSSKNVRINNQPEERIISDFIDFEIVPLNLSVKLNSISFNNSLGIICGDSGKAVLSRDYGKSWSKVDSFTIVSLNDAQILDNRRIIIAGEKGNLFLSDDAGVTWEKILLPSSNSFFDINQNSDGDLILVGNNGSVLFSSDYGRTWETLNSGVNNLLFKSCFINPNNGFIIGWDGLLLKSEDAGRTWKKVELETDAYLKDILFMDKKDGFICGGEGKLLITSNGGEDWDSFTQSITFAGISSMNQLKSKNILITTTKGEIIILDTEKKSLGKISTSFPFGLQSSASNTNGEIYICGMNGLLLRGRIK